MKLLIAYASKTGCTREMATMLASLLPNHEVTLADLAGEQPDPACFDYVVLGTPIRMNRAHKAVVQYIQSHEDVLCRVPHTLFLCCAFSDQFDHYCRVAFSDELIKSAEECVYFGGDLSLSRHHGIEKLLVRMIRNGILESEEDDAVLPNLMPEHVRVLADRLRVKTCFFQKGVDKAALL